MSKALAGFIGAIIGATAGAFFVWLILRQTNQSSTTKKNLLTNKETWDMWETADGHMHVDIHRKVKGG